MAGCLDNCRLPEWDWLPHVREKRNTIASIVAGTLFAIGWWFAVDAASAYSSNDVLPKAVHTCGAVATVALVMVNAISNSQVRGDTYDSGCLGYIGARIWLFVGFVLGFAALIGACWVLFGMYVVAGKPDVYPGVAIFLQNACIFFSAIIFKFGRTETLWE